MEKILGLNLAVLHHLMILQTWDIQPRSWKRSGQNGRKKIKVCDILEAPERSASRGRDSAKYKGQVRKDHWMWKQGRCVGPWGISVELWRQEHDSSRFKRKWEWECGWLNQVSPLQSHALKSSRETEVLSGRCGDKGRCWGFCFLFKIWVSGTCLYANGNDLTTEGNSDKKCGEPTFSRQEDYIRNIEFRLLSTCVLLKMYFEKNHSP